MQRANAAEPSASSSISAPLLFDGVYSQRWPGPARQSRVQPQRPVDEVSSRSRRAATSDAPGEKAGYEALHPAAASERFRAAAKVIENALAGREYLVGDRFTVADLVCAAVLGFGRMLELTGGLASVAAYLDRAEARPARRRAVEVGAPTGATA